MIRVYLVYRSLKPLLKRAGLKEIRFHDLRHTFATLMLEQGENPKVVQEILGHSQISLTLDTYSHVLLDIQKEAIGRLGRLLPLNALLPQGPSVGARASFMLYVLLQIRRKSERARQDSNLRPSDS